ncbi:MAG: hypothetical protein PHU23_15465, partial [Dehalococcoidales bacterium]|nr:hypothetical protein [Dehalococcoidales bacterium]
VVFPGPLTEFILPVMNVPLKAQGINIFLHFRVRRALQFSEKPMKQLSAAHTGLRFLGSRQINIDNFGQQFPIFNCLSHK